jgi:hypothetical protein
MFKFIKKLSILFLLLFFVSTSLLAQVTRPSVGPVVYPSVWSVTSYGGAGGGIELDLTNSGDIDGWQAKYAPSDLFTRNSTWHVFDYAAMLQEDAIDEYGLYGGRLNTGVWYNTEVDGVTPLENEIGFSTWLTGNNQLAGVKYRDFDAWDSVTATVVRDQVGVDGNPSGTGASLVTDDNAAAQESVYEDTAISDDTNWYSGSVLIKKDSDTTRYVGIKLSLEVGTDVDELILFNTQTGVVTREALSAGEYDIFDAGGWWFITIACQNNNTGAGSGRLRLYPAMSTNGTDIVNTATGSIIADWAQFSNGRRCPIHLVEGGTSAAEQTMIIADATKVSKLILPTTGSIFVKFKSLPDYSDFINDTIILSNGDCEIRAEALTSGVSFNDGTNDTVGSAGTPSGVIKAVIRWQGTSVYITTINGTTTGAYAENFGTGAIEIGNNTANNTFPGILMKYIFYPGVFLSEIEADALVVPDP